MRNNPKVDVIIPSYKPKESFIKLIEMLEKQTYPVNKIIVMNTEEKYYAELMFNHSLDKVYDNLHVTHISKREFNHGKTRRDGVLRSDADIFVMMTDDAVPRSEEMIEKLIHPLVTDKAAVSYARQVARKNADEIEKFTRNFNYPRKSVLKSSFDIKEMGIKTYFCSNVCAAYNREIYDRLGGFEEYIIFNEDMVFAAHAIKEGYKIAYTASAEVVHSHNYRGIALFKRNFDLGVSQADYPEIFRNVSSSSEGRKLVSRTIEHLKKRKKSMLIPKLIVDSAFKYAGYRLGLMYKFIPKAIVKKLSSLPEYWVGKDVYENNKKIDFHAGYGIHDYERTDGRKIHKASDRNDTYNDLGRKSTLKDEIKVRPKDKMVDRSHDVFTNREVAWKSDNEPDVFVNAPEKKEEDKKE
ncbi:MAG: glycosyltransferase family 2 protein [Lachnospiraceae bacterium]|nr:glycosyltransferase family 2 protein [Lachnospiraceae bacterium]